MPSTLALLAWPFLAAWRLIKLLFLPVGIGTGVWMLADPGPFLTTALIVCGVWALLMLRLWFITTRGRLRSLGRGTFKLR